MCGLVGILHLRDFLETSNTAIALRRMLASIRHRGPDQFGLYLDSRVGLGSARLSIIDLFSGQQPIANEDGTVWVVFNGEIFNYLELRPQLEARGHRFTTNSDTEVLVHMYEEFGPDFLAQCNGQFAIALWDSRTQTLFLARDRLGVRPLFYTMAGDTLIFGSEVKALLNSGQVRAELEPVALDQVFTYWSALSPRTVFKGIKEVPPGSYLMVRQDQITVNAYWQLRFPLVEASPAQRSWQDYLDELTSLLIDAVQLRLRADVPVGAYLSGGLDSSLIATIIRNYTGNRLDTFSVTFSDPAFDESAYQRQMARFLGTDHQVVHITSADVGRAFPAVIWHTETPLLRTGPVPLFLLSKLVRDSNYKVVLTGEGADEFLAGYNIFKEAKIRRFWARQPQSRLRPQLFQRLYQYIGSLSQVNTDYLAAFFGEGLTDVTSPDYSHMTRWRNTSRIKRFFTEEVRQAGADQADPAVAYPPDFATWDPLHQAQYLEITTFLSQYLLSSQGDRVSMGHSVEGRFPFLDYRVVEFCNHLPPSLKLHGLTEKYLLRKLGATCLPEDIWHRPKHPYRAPITSSFLRSVSSPNGPTPDYVREMLSPEQLQAAGLFKPAAVSHLVRKIEQGLPASETDDMTLVGILSSQLVYHQFIAHFIPAQPLSHADNVKVCLGQDVSQGEFS